MTSPEMYGLRTVNGKTASFESVDSGWGVYPKSNLSAKEGREHLRRTAEYLRKYADDAGGQETMLEQSMGSLGYTYLRDRVPKLMPHLVGFQLIDKNEERTKAFGAFAFRMNNKWFVVPIVFSRGDLKGHEIMWAKAEDVFVPLREGWVNYFQSNKTYQLGKPGPPANGMHYGSDVPDVSRVMRPGGLFGKNSHWVEACLPMLAALKTASPNFLRQYDVPGVDELCRTHEKTAAAVLSLARARPVIKLGLDQMYPGLVDSLPQLAAELAVGKIAVELDPTDAEGEKEDEPFQKLIEAPAPASEPETSPKVEVYFRETLADVPKPVPDSVKEEAMAEGVAYVDNRQEDEKSVVVDPNMTYENPTENGLYDLLVGGGKTVEAFIVAAKASDPGYRIAVTRGEKKIYEGRVTEMWTVGGAKALSEYVKAVDALPKAKGGLKKHQRHLLLSQKGDAALVTVRDSLGDNEYVVNVGGYCCSETLSSNTPQQSPADDHKWWGDHITKDITDGQGNSRLLIGGDVRGLRRFGNDLLASEEVRHLSVDGYDSDKLPARIIDRALGVLRGFEPLSVRKTAAGKLLIESKIGRQEVTPLVAPAVLMLSHGFSKAAALELAATGHGGRTVMVKYAYTPSSLVSPEGEAPPFPEDHVGMEPVGRGYVPSQYASRDFVQVPGMMGDGMAGQDPDYFQQAEDTNQAIGLAQQGAASGDKELMDFGVLASMAHIRGIKNYIDGHWRKIVDGMDSYGRILLMLMLHPDDFTEEYGSHGLPQLEDAIRNAFEISGDVALELAEKTLKPLGDSANPVDLSAEN